MGAERGGHRAHQQVRAVRRHSSQRAEEHLVDGESAWLRLREGRTNLEELVRMLPYHAIVDFRQQCLWKHERLSLAV